MNKKGFTLMELLAVIVILGIIMVIAVPNFINTRKKAAEQEAIKMENMIKDLGPAIYSYEKIKNPDGVFMKKIGNEKIYIRENDLASAGYLKNSALQNPFGKKSCDAVLIIDTDINFEAKIYCEGAPDDSEFNNTINEATTKGLIFKNIN